MKTRNIVQDEALEAMSKVERGTIAVSMRVGKTLVGLRHMDNHYSDTLRVLVVAPKLSIFQSWKDDAEKFDLVHLLDHITFTTYLSLTKQTLDYDIVYLDECHNLLYNHDEWLSNFKGKIVGLTGTPPRVPVSEKGKMVDMYCPIVYKYIVKEAVADKILNDYRIIIHNLSLATDNTLKVEVRGKSWYTSELKSYEYWSGRLDNASTAKEQQIMSIMRMKALMGFPSKEVIAKEIFFKSENKCILFANTQEQADRLCPYSYHSKNPTSEENLQKFKSGEIIRLSCVLQLNEGITIPELKEGILLHSYGNNTKTAQRIGRMLSLNPKDTATVHILCYRDTVDTRWVASALEDFDESKITYVEY